MAEPIRFVTSNTNSNNESNRGSKRKRHENNEGQRVTYENYVFNESENSASNNNSKSSSSRSTSKGNSNSNSNSNNNEAVIPANSNIEYENINDVDYVRVDVEGDGSCFYRALYVAAFMYPIERDIIKRQLLPEFASESSLLLRILKAFGHPRNTLLPEENAVIFMRKQLSKGILGNHPDETINEACNRIITNLYDLIINNLCQAFNSDLSKESNILLERPPNNNNEVYEPSGYQVVIESMNRQISNFFTKTPVVQLTLKNFKDLVSTTILNKTTFASELDIKIITEVLLTKNIVLRTTSLNKFARDQTFPIIEGQKPVLLLDNIDENHYNALVPKVEFDAYADTAFKNGRTLNSEVSREPSTTEEIISKKGKKKTVTKRGQPIIFSKRTFNYRKAKGLAGGRKTLKRRGRK